MFDIEQAILELECHAATGAEISKEVCALAIELLKVMLKQND